MIIQMFLLDCSLSTFSSPSTIFNSTLSVNSKILPLAFKHNSNLNLILNNCMRHLLPKVMKTFSRRRERKKKRRKLHSCPMNRIIFLNVETMCSRISVQLFSTVSIISLFLENTKWLTLFKDSFLKEKCILLLL